MIVTRNNLNKDSFSSKRRAWWLLYIWCLSSSGDWPVVVSAFYALFLAFKITASHNQPPREVAEKRKRSARMSTPTKRITLRRVSFGLGIGRQTLDYTETLAVERVDLDRDIYPKMFPESLSLPFLIHEACFFKMIFLRSVSSFISI